MNQSKYPIQNYVPYNPDKYSEGGFGHSLGYTLDKDKYQKIINNPHYHFTNSYITNFDIIHHKCRGDNLEFTEEYYKTIHENNVNQEIKQNDEKDRFVAEAINSERKDVFLNKNLVIQHFHKMKVQNNLEQNNIFLLSMKKRAFNNKKKYTDECKSLSF